MLLALWLSLGVWQKDRATPGRLTFTVLALSAATWCLGELMVEREIVSELVADRVKYAGILTLPAFWVGAAAHGGRLELVRRVPWFPLVLLTPELFAYALMYSGPWSSVFLTTVTDGGNDLRGPLWWILAGYNYLLLLTGSSILIWTAIARQRRGWVRQLVLGMASLFPLAANIAYVASGLLWAHDPTPALLGVALLVLRSAIFSGGLLQILPISQHDLLGQLPIPALLTDRRGSIIAINPAAERRLALSAREALGRALDAVLEQTKHEARADLTPIRSHGQESGQLVLLDLPSKPED